jgi:acyl-CoA synthetase (NDP forming)
VPPFTAEEALEALQSLRTWPILAGVRGEPPADTQKLAELAVALGRLVVAQDWIESVDLNPVLVREAGAGAVVLDALVTGRTGAS